jgi:HlyD family secretion protein
MNAEVIKFKLRKFGWLRYLISLILFLSVYRLTQQWPVAKVPGVPVKKELATKNLLVNGTVQGPKIVNIVCKMGGKVIAMPVTVRQQVHAGQVLIILENKESMAAVLQAKSAVTQAVARLGQINHLSQAGSEQSLLKAQTTLDNARKQYTRVRELSDKGYVSQDQLNDALHNLAIAQSQLASSQFLAKANRGKGSNYAVAELALNKARAQERIAHEKLENLSIKADVDGLVSSKMVEVGNTVTLGTTLIVVSPTGNTQLAVQIDQGSIPLLKLGQKAMIVADGYLDQRFEAVLSYISPDIAAINGSVEIKFDVLSPPDYLRQDMAVSIDIDVAHRADITAFSTGIIHDASRNKCCILPVADRLI